MPCNIHFVVKGLDEEWLEQPERYARQSRVGDEMDSLHVPSPASSLPLVFGLMGGLEAFGKWGEGCVTHVPLQCCAGLEKTYEASVTGITEPLLVAEGKLELRLLILAPSPASEKGFPVKNPSCSAAHFTPSTSSVEAGHCSNQHVDPHQKGEGKAASDARCYRRVAVECGSTFPRMAALSFAPPPSVESHSSEPPKEESFEDGSASSPLCTQNASIGEHYEVILDLNAVGPPEIRFAKIVDFFPSLDVLSHPTSLASPLLALHFYSHNPRFPFSLYERKLVSGSESEFSDKGCGFPGSTLSSSTFEIYGLKKIQASGLSWQEALPKPLPKKHRGEPQLPTSPSLSSPSFVDSRMIDSEDDLWCVKELSKVHAIKDPGLNPCVTQDYWTAIINTGQMEDHAIEILIHVPLKNTTKEKESLPASAAYGGAEKEKDNESSLEFAYGSTMLAASMLSQGTQGIIDIPVLCTRNSKQNQDAGKIWVVMHIQYTLHYPLMHRNNNFRLLRSDQSIQAVTSTKPVGHRGLGKTFTQRIPGKMNFKRKLAENSIEAFVAADQRGCEMVEFDVMLTHDGIPIVFHDPVVELLAVAEPSEKSRSSQNVVPISVPVHQLTGKQLQWVVKQSKHREIGKSTTLKDFLVRHWNDIVSLGRGIIQSKHPQIKVHRVAASSPSNKEKDGMTPGTSTPAGMEGEEGGLTLPPTSAVKQPSPTHHKDTLSEGGREASSRMSSLVKNRVDITHPVPELKDLFFNTPSRLRFDIEVKYPFQPVHDENIFFQKDVFEINRFVDSILNVVMEYGGEERHIAFSSFEPEICVALAMKQSRYDVFFLSGSSNDLKDYRSYYVEGAIQFASAHNLSGISILSSFLRSGNEESEDSTKGGKLIVDAAHRRRLKVWTWGEANTDPHFFQQQIEEMAVDGVITDNVVRK